MAAAEAVGEAPRGDLGRYEVALDPADRWKLRTPGLRNVALTPPDMHDGGRPHPGQDEAIRPLGLCQRDHEDIVAFLAALTSPEVPRLVEEARAAAPDNW